MLSARNILEVTIKNIEIGAVSAVIVADFGGNTLKASITLDSAKNLGLKAGMSAFFIIKASDVIIADSLNGLKISASNQIKGKVKKLNDGVVNSEVVLDANGKEISSIITKSSASKLSFEVGKEVIAVIKASNIIVGVKE
ncbi:MAG: TOBE domain-containing protein [Campylobacter sp.]|nr:TOBE domain-containing protein [Campylobacter sp.]